MKKRKAQTLEKNMEQLLSYLLTEDGIHDLKEGLIVHDCDIQ